MRGRLTTFSSKQRPFGPGFPDVRRDLLPGQAQHRAQLPVQGVLRPLQIALVHLAYLPPVMNGPVAPPAHALDEARQPPAVVGGQYLVNRSLMARMLWLSACSSGSWSSSAMSCPTSSAVSSGRMST